jgi:hypothetical protein
LLYLLFIPFSRAKADFWLSTSADVNFNNIINYDAAVGLNYSYEQIALSANLRHNRISNKYFQPNVVKSLPNLKRPLELSSPYQYFYGIALEYGLYSSERHEILAKFSYHDSISYEKALELSKYLDIFRFFRLGMAYSFTLDIIKATVTADYYEVTEGFRNRLGLSIGGRQNFGRNSALLITYEYLHDIEKTTYSALEVPHEKPDDSLFDVRYNNVIYRLPKQSLLNRIHNFSISNIFKVDRNIETRIGLGFSLDERGQNNYRVTIDIVSAIF